MTAVENPPTTDESTTAPARCARRRAGSRSRCSDGAVSCASAAIATTRSAKGFICPKGSTPHSSSTRTPTGCAARSSAGATTRPPPRGTRSAGTRPSPRSSAASRPILEQHGRDAVGALPRQPQRAHPGRHALQPRRCSRRWARSNLFSASTGRPDAQARVERAAVRQRRSRSRCPTSTAPTTC